MENPLVFPDENAIIVGHGLVNREKGGKGVARPNPDIELLNELGQKHRGKKFYLPNQILDTHEIALDLDVRGRPNTSEKGRGLQDLLRYFGVEDLPVAHDAGNDVKMTRHLFELLQKEAEKQGKSIRTLKPKFDKRGLFYENQGGSLSGDNNVNEIPNDIRGTSRERDRWRIVQEAKWGADSGRTGIGRQILREMDRQDKAGYHGEDGADDGRRKSGIYEGEWNALSNLTLRFCPRLQYLFIFPLVRRRNSSVRPLPPIVRWPVSRNTVPWRSHLRMPLAGRFRPALVVGQNKNDVRTLGLLRRKGYRYRNKKRNKSTNKRKSDMGILQRAVRTPRVKPRAVPTLAYCAVLSPLPLGEG